MQHFNQLSPEKLLTRVVHGTQLIIVGDSPDKGTEYEEALKLMPYALVMNINNAGQERDVVPQMVATQHGAVANFIATPRMPLDYIPSDAFVMCSACNGDQHERVDVVYDGHPMWGTSTMFGVLCALYHGFDDILIVGCDMRGGYGGEAKLDSWRAWSDIMKGHVRIISGKLIGILEAV